MGGGVSKAAPAPRFQRSMTAAARVGLSGEGEPDAHGLRGALARAVSALHVAGGMLSVDFKAAHESGGTGWLNLVFITEGLYQQLHVAATLAVLLAHRALAAPTGCRSAGALLDAVDAQSAHPL